MKNIFEALDNYIQGLKNQITMLEWERDELQKKLDAAEHELLTATNPARGE